VPPPVVLLSPPFPPALALGVLTPTPGTPPAAPARPTGDARLDARAEERALVARALAGDAAAERALYDAHVDRVYRLAFRITGDDDLARDVTQDAFVRAFDRLGEFRHEAALSTWLHRIALSVALNAVERTRRLRAREVPLDDAALAAPDPARPADPDLRAQLAAAVDALPPGYRAVFLMHDLEGYTHEEIGAALGVRPGTSKAQLFHARARLRTRLAAFRRKD
jgi:RNA polymerase sigma-70 factor (ECF subfamily)